MAVDDDYDFGSVFQFAEHFYLIVGRETRENSRRVEIVEEFAAEFYVEFTAELVDSFKYFFGL